MNMNVKNTLFVVLVIFIGFIWFYAEIYWIGFAARWLHLPFERHVASLRSFLGAEQLWTILVQLVPSLICAWLISLIKPRRWLLYSILVAMPTVLLSIITLIRYGLPGSTIIVIAYTVGLCLLIVQVPFLLFCFYKIKWNKGTRTGTIMKQT